MNVDVNRFLDGLSLAVVVHVFLVFSGKVSTLMLNGGKGVRKSVRFCRCFA